MKTKFFAVLLFCTFLTTHYSKTSMPNQMPLSVEQVKLFAIKNAITMTSTIASGYVQQLAMLNITPSPTTASQDEMQLFAAAKNAVEQTVLDLIFASKTAITACTAFVTAQEEGSDESEELFQATRQPLEEFGELMVAVKFAQESFFSVAEPLALADALADS